MTRRTRRGKRHKEREKRKVLILLMAVIAVAIVLTIIMSRMFAVSQNRDNISSIGGIPVTEDLIDKGSMARPGTTRKIKYIVIHETGNTGWSANAASHGQYLYENENQEKKSWHYTVDDEEIYQHIPDNEIAFHAGDGLKAGGGNACGIGIEMCVNKGGNYEKTLKNTAVLTAFLLKEYGLNIDDVKMHRDFSGKKCPEELIKSGRWNEFLKMVKKQ